MGSILSLIERLQRKPSLITEIRRSAFEPQIRGPSQIIEVFLAPRVGNIPSELLDRFLSGLLQDSTPQRSWVVEEGGAFPPHAGRVFDVPVGLVHVEWRVTIEDEDVQREAGYVRTILPQGPPYRVYTRVIIRAYAHEEALLKGIRRANVIRN